MSSILAVYDEDTEYANQLTEYLNRKRKAFMQVRVFTKPESLRDYYENNVIDVLLLGEGKWDDEMKNKNIRNICILSEGNGVREGMEYPVIYKFQSARDIWEEILSYYPFLEQSSDGPAVSGDKTNLISVMSIGLGAERSVFSLLLANRYSREKKTLYINLDVCQAQPDMLQWKRKEGLSDFIYYLKQKPSNLITKMQGLIQNTEYFDYIPGVVLGLDILELTAEDMAVWLGNLRRWGEYEAIVFEVGNIFEGAFRLLQDSSQVLMIAGEDSWGQAKYRDLKEQLSFAGYEEILEKSQSITISGEDRLRLQRISQDELFGEEGNGIAASYLE